MKIKILLLITLLLLASACDTINNEECIDYVPDRIDHCVINYRYDLQYSPVLYSNNKYELILSRGTDAWHYYFWGQNNKICYNDYMPFLVYNCEVELFIRYY